MNLGLLSIFKYSSFFIQNVNNIFGTSFNDPQLPLPIGISFYTFQSMSYTIDLYMRNIKVQKNIINFTTYVTLFPQIVAGPIVRYADVEEEIDGRKVSVDMVGCGAGIFLKGLAKKVLLANNIGMLWTEVRLWIIVKYRHLQLGWVYLHLHFKFILIFQDIQIWQ